MDFSTVWKKFSTAWKNDELPLRQGCEGQAAIPRMGAGKDLRGGEGWGYDARQI